MFYQGDRFHFLTRSTLSLQLLYAYYFFTQSLIISDRREISRSIFLGTSCIQTSRKLAASRKVERITNFSLEDSNVKSIISSR